jgi:hypothetical protein
MCKIYCYIFSHIFRNHISYLSERVVDVFRNDIWVCEKVNVTDRIEFFLWPCVRSVPRQKVKEDEEGSLGKILKEEGQVKIYTLYSNCNRSRLISQSHFLKLHSVEIKSNTNTYWLFLF